MNYTTLILDAFDTVVHINREKLPTCRVNGTVIQTTAPAIHSVYTEHFGKLDFDVFYKALSQSFIEISEIRRKEHREIRSQERFRLLLGTLGHETEQIPPEVLDCLTRAHMDQLQEAFEVRPETIQFLDWAGERFRCGMISNFDYAPALHTALDRFGIRSAFETIVISVDVGWRKPSPIIFKHAFTTMGITPSEALFIGDQLYLDVYGSLNSGMDVVWLETDRQDWMIPEIPEPTYKVRSIAEIISLLENIK